MDLDKSASCQEIKPRRYARLSVLIRRSPPSRPEFQMLLNSVSEIANYGC
jgi:hypothetical protein